MEKIKDFIQKNKKVTFIAIAVMVLSLPFIINEVLKRQDVRQRAQVAPSISFAIAPTTGNVAVDGRFNVELVMNAGSNDIGALEFTINYPSDKLTLVSDTPNSSYTVANKQSTPGTYKATLLNITSTPISGNGIKVVTFTFEGKSVGQALVKLDPATLQVTASGSDQFVPVDNPNSIEGNYTVGTVASGATLSFTPASNSYAIGDTIAVYAMLDANQTVNAVGFDINYPANLLTVVAVSKDAFDIEASKVISNGKISLAYGSVTPLSGHLIVAKITFQPITAGNMSLTYSNAQAISNVNNQNILTGTSGGNYTITGSTVTPTVTPSPTPTRTPTPTPTRTPTPIPPTNTPVPPTNTPIPTVPPTQAELNVSLILRGIGIKTGDNTSPVNKNRSVSLEIFNAQNQSVAKLPGTLKYIDAAGNYQGSFTITPQLSSGNYLASVKFPNTLSKRLPGILTFVAGQTTNTPAVQMVSGDLSNDNQLELQDWTNMVACTREETGCTDTIKVAADLNDDGQISPADAAIMHREFSIRAGEQ